jgi:hypothetical protein
VYLLDTRHEISLLMATNRNRLLAGEYYAQEGSYEQVVGFSRFGVGSTDGFHGFEGEQCAGSAAAAGGERASAAAAPGCERTGSAAAAG